MVAPPPRRDGLSLVEVLTTGRPSRQAASSHRGDQADRVHDLRWLVLPLALQLLSAGGNGMGESPVSPTSSTTSAPASRTVRTRERTRYVGHGKVRITGGKLCGSTPRPRSTAFVLAVICVGDAACF